MPPKRKAEADADAPEEPAATKRTRTATSSAIDSTTTAPPAKRARARASATAPTKASAAKTAPKPRAPRGSKASSVVSASFTSQDGSQSQTAPPPKPKRIRAPRAEKPGDRPQPIVTTETENPTETKTVAKTIVKPTVKAAPKTAAKTVAKTTEKTTTKTAAKTTAQPGTNVNKQKNKDIFDLPSSSEDELQRPISITPAGRTTRGRKPAATTTSATVTNTAAKPTARRTRAAVEQEDKEKSPTGAISVVISTPRSRPVLQETTEVNNQEEGEDEQTEGQQEEDELIVEAQMDEDEDIVIGGRISPAKPQARSKRPSRGRPSLGTEGLVDPFDTPKARKDAEESRGPLASATKATPIVKAITPSKQTPKSVRKAENDIEVTPEGIAALKKQVLNKVMGRQRPNLVGVDDEYRNVHHLLSQTVTAGEGNSMLIIGSRGSGKTTLVETAISSLSESHSGEFHVVRLNGLLQTDDKLALREIWRQLGVEMELDENEQPKQTNFADTLQSILAILSHPDELAAQEEEEPTLPGEEPDVARTSTAVVFVLDEFDHFVLQPRQTLLYNLFDIAQAKKAPIAVLGLTCKVDVVDSLEKRVKSRFSHRTEHLKLPSTIDAFWEVVKEGLAVDMGSDDAIGDIKTEQYFRAWNSHIEDLRHQPHFATFLRRNFAQSKTPAQIFNATIMALSTITPSSPFPEATAWTPLSPPLSNLYLLHSLSDLQLALLISAARLEALNDMESVNFDMVYDEYLKLCAKSRVQNTPSGGVGRVWSKSVGLGAWEGLEGMGLVVVDTARKGRWRIDVGLMEVKERTRGTQWARWCKEVL